MGTTSRRMLAFLTLAVLLAGCGRSRVDRAPADGGTPPPQAPADTAGPEAAATPLQRQAEALAEEIYAALAAGDTRPLESRLDPGGCEVMVESDTGGEPFYAVVDPGGAADWGPLLAWTESRPAETIQEVTGSVSPHDPSYVLVSMRLRDGYFYLGLANGKAITKVFAQRSPAVWD